MSTQDPYAKYGGSSDADPYAKYGGQRITQTPDEVRAAVEKASTVAPLLPQSASEWLSSAGNLTKNFINGVNPLPGLKSMYEAGAVNTIKGLTEAQLQQFTKAQEAFHAGNYSEAIGHTIAGGIPLVGPAAARAGEQIGSGDISGGLGQAAALIAPFGASAAFSKAKIPIIPKMLTANPVEAAAVDFGMKAGLPVDAATATGNQGVRAIQWLADKSPGGALVNKATKAEGAAKFAQVGEDLAAKANALPVNPAQAGEGVRAALESKIQDYHGAANQAYGDLRAIEADPKNLKTVQTGTKQVQSVGFNAQGQGPVTITNSVPINEKIALPVDMRAAKTALKPVYDRLMRQMPVTQQQASGGLKALENVVNGPDFAAASQVDSDLGAIKSIARGADSPYLRDVSQGLASKAVTELSGAVDRAILQGGPDAVDALRKGREATKSKYEVADVLDKVREEPVQAFNQMIYSKDAGVEQLKAIAKHAPGEMPKVGRAFLDDMLNTATSQGAFDQTQGLWAKWQKLGPQTKSILFKDPQLVGNLNDFFFLAKKVAENPNPSGTALVGQTGYVFMNPATGVPYVIGMAGLSKMMHSPVAVRALTDGLKVSGKGLASAMATTRILKLAGDAAQPVGAESSPSPRIGLPALVPAQ